MAWVPERCGVGWQLLPWCAPDDPDEHDADRPGAVYYRPPTARFAWECSTLAGPLDIEQFRRMAAATLPFVIARELWGGELAQADPFTVGGDSLTNRYLASPDAEVVGEDPAADLNTGLAALEQAALEASQGQKVMLHLPVLLTARLGEYVRRVGPDMLTRLDNVVVADGAYPGTGPAGDAVDATAWAYATTPVQVRTGTWAVADEPALTVDRARNTVTAWAEVPFAATFDPCVHLATEITI